MADASDDDARVRLTFEGRVATLALIREARMNAFDAAMHMDIRSALAEVRGNSDLRALVITGSGRAFSAGQDLGERAASFARNEVPDLVASLDDNYNPLIRALAALPIPVVAAVNGVAFGAGAALAIACDIVLAAQSARFQFGFVNVGLGPDSGSSYFLPRLVGNARAMDLALTGRPVAADEALAMGLVSRVVADGDLIATAQTIAAELAQRSAAAITAIKRQLRTHPDLGLDAALDAERDAQGLLGASADYREAVLRFTRPRT